jgi:hypothetical protein
LIQAQSRSHIPRGSFADGCEDRALILWHDIGRRTRLRSRSIKPDISGVNSIAAPPIARRLPIAASTSATEH